MSNTYTNKVQLADGTTIVDLTGDDVTAADVAQGKIFHLPTGEQATGTASGGGLTLDGISNIASGYVTFAQRYQTTGNRAIVNLSDIGFTPTRFYLTASPPTVAQAITALEGGTETSGIMTYVYFEEYHNPSLSRSFYNRGMSRLTAQNPTTASSAKADTSWTSQTNYHLYNNGTTIYYRTASGYGVLANSKYYWLAIRDEVDTQ